MHIRELWSESDRADLGDLRAALDVDDLAGALFAIEGASPEDREAARGSLDAWADAVGERLMIGADAIDSLRRVLVGDVALVGDRESYYHPDNSALSRVIANRRGLPITLSVVWILVGERSGLPVDGLALPGHFIVRVGADPVDPFRRGQVMDEAACRAMVERIQPNLDWDDHWLEAVDDRAIASRVLRNLANAHVRGGDPVATYRAVRMLAEVQPDDASAQLSWAHVAQQVGAEGEAATLFEGICDRFPGTDVAREAADRMQRMSVSGRWLH